MALEGADHDVRRDVHFWAQAVTEGAQALLERDLEKAFARLRPQADPRQSESAPGKELARIDLSRGCHVGMAEHARGRNGMTRDDFAAQVNHRFDLRARKRAVAEFMAGIDDLDADG